MKHKKRTWWVVAVITALFMSSCMLPGMIPLKSTPEGPMPTLETNTQEVLKVLSGENWRYLQAVPAEQYSEEDLAKPGALNFTANINDEVPVYINYGWCAVDEDTLKQNFEHIDVKIYINGEELGSDVVHNLSYTSQDNLACLDFGILTYDWPEGEYDVKTVATFEEKINDGIADYDPGDYIFEYKVTVKKQKEGASAPSRLSLQIGI